MKRLGFLVFILCVSAVSFAQSTETCTAAHEVRRPVVTSFRVLNTAQVQFYRANGRYANISELLKSPETKNASEMIAAAGNDRTALGTPDDPLPGYNLRFIVAPDGKTYAMTATKKDGPCRLIGATTDDRGIIYLIEPLR